jgi:UDP-N-acetylmuramoylalanine--D-glutamate ligase
MFSVQRKRVVVVGAARSGVAAATLLVRRGASVVLTELRDQIPESEMLIAQGVRLELGGHRRETLLGADLIVLSPGVPTTLQHIEAARARGVSIIGEVELASRWLQGTMVAITGTKGKSTTTTLIGRMLTEGGVKALVGGNIGQPLSDHVDQSAPDVVHVVEVSSFQLETTETFHPRIAVLLNVTPDHLDRHPSLKEYASVKARIFANQTPADWAVVNADDPVVLELARRARAQRLEFGLDKSKSAVTAEPERDGIYRRTGQQQQRLVPLSSVRLHGRHSLYDVLAAAAVGNLLGVTPEAMTRAVQGFSGLEHALEAVGAVSGIRFINDSKATNVAAARLAIESFSEGLAVILGGRFKGGDLSVLRVPLETRGATVVAIGEARPLIREALSSSVPVVEADSMADAVRKAFGALSPGGVVLLAPACASFDMFRDYAERGRSFKQEVARLAQEVRGSREQ